MRESKLPCRLVFRVGEELGEERPCARAGPIAIENLGERAATDADFLGDLRDRERIRALAEKTQGQLVVADATDAFGLARLALALSFPPPRSYAEEDVGHGRGARVGFLRRLGRDVDGVNADGVAAIVQAGRDFWERDTSP